MAYKYYLKYEKNNGEVQVIDGGYPTSGGSTTLDTAIAHINSTIAFYIADNGTLQTDDTSYRFAMISLAIPYLPAEGYYVYKTEDWIVFDLKPLETIATR